LFWSQLGLLLLRQGIISLPLESPEKIVDLYSANGIIRHARHNPVYWHFDHPLPNFYLEAFEHGCV
jgi:hypothetical protein